MATTQPTLRETFRSNRTAVELPDTSLFWRWVGRATRPVIGWIILAVGALLIFIGYLGVSREALVAKQLPFLVSGGIFGVALVVFGSMILATEEMRRDSGRLDRLEAMMTELHAALLVRTEPQPSVSAAQTVRKPQRSRGENEGQTGETADDAGFFALPTGTVYHRPACAMLDGKADATAVDQGDISARGLTACRLCEPALVDA